MESTYQLKFGKAYKEISISDKNLLAFVSPNDLPGVKDEQQELRKSLDQPIDSPSLKELAENKNNVAILASDMTRPAPSYKIIPPLLDELNEAGVEDENITVYFGLGYHREHTEEEKKALVGEEIYNRINCVDHELDNCINIGTSSQGTPIEVLKPVYESDLIIGTGNLELHYRAGYSGGHKALMPGVCSKATIQKNHEMKFKSGTAPGKIEGNPLRDDIEEIGEMACVQFILNVVLNTKKEIVKSVAGHPINAHREGVKYVDDMYKYEIPKKGDIVIASAGGYPKDVNLYQAQKGLENASYAVKDGGTIILLAECREGLGDETFADWMLKAKTIEKPIDWILEEFILGAHKAAVICQVLQRANASLISVIPKETVKTCFFEPFMTLEEAYDNAIKKAGENAEVVVMPYANSTMPEVKG